MQQKCENIQEEKCEQNMEFSIVSCTQQKQETLQSAIQMFRCPRAEFQLMQVIEKMEKVIGWRHHSNCGTAKLSFYYLKQRLVMAHMHIRTASIETFVRWIIFLLLKIDK